MADQAEIGLLRSQIDELATALLVSGPDVELIEGLNHLTRSAEGCGEIQLAQLAGKLIQEVSAQESGRREEFLQAGLAQLQAMLLNTTGAPVASAPERPPASSNQLAQDPELVGDFITEAREHLSTIEGNMLILERNPEQDDSIHTVFRGFHTIKGLAGFLEFIPIRDVAHEVETLLDLARNHKLQVTGHVVDTVLESVDFLKQAVEIVEGTLQGVPGELRSDPLLVARIKRIISGDQLPLEAEAAPSLEALAEAVTRPPERLAEEPAVEASRQDPKPVDQGVEQGPVAKAKSVEASSVRVQTLKLDYLMDMVGELVITQSLIRHNPALGSIQNPKLVSDFAQLTRITGEVQRTTMGMRMITIGQVFQRSSRLIRDLSRKAGKQIQLEISGEDTEVDKTIAEELTDPLLHMVRNSCDHGVEEPAERVAAGKNPTARIRLAAYHQGGQIVVEVSDDGHGLDRERILAKAVQRGLIEANAHLSEQEIFNLIFEPGFTTAAQITDLSGRGVGMDVVRKNMQKLRGRIEIQSKVGQGTTFFLKLPLTLAIIEGLVVGVGKHRYIVPIYTVRELISPKETTITTVHGRNEMAMVRNRILPVVRLAKRFNVAPKSDDPTSGLLIVTECQDQSFCLLVDEVLGKQEVVIKSLGETLKNVPGIAGGAILGDGRVGLILDIEAVFRE